MNRLALAFCCTSLLALAFAGSSSAQTFFVGNPSSNTITSFNVGANGVPAATGAAATTTGAGPNSLNITPNGAVLTQANYTSASTVASWAIGATSSLTSTGPAIATNEGPIQSAISPNGKFLYQTSGFGGAGIKAYAIGADGKLTLIETEPTTSNGNGISITPDGRYLYECTAIGGLWDFAIAADGSLSQLNGDGKVPGTNGCLGATITPNGQMLVTGELVGGSSLDQIRSRRIGADGSLTSVDTETVGYRPDEISASPNGRFIVSFDKGSGGSTSASVSGTAIDADGQLTHKTTSFLVGAVGQFLGGGAISPDGLYGYAALAGAGNNIYGFKFDADGGVGETTGSPYPSGGSINSLAAHQVLAFKPAQGPVAKISSSGTGATRSFSAAGSTDADSAIGSYAWDFGDGQTASTATANTSHKFTTPGVFDVKVTAVATDNCQNVQIYTGRSTLCNPGSSATIKVDALPPTISGLKLSPSKFKVNKKAKAPKAAKAAKGSFAKYKLSEAGTLTFQVQKPSKGRTVGKSCVKESKSNKKKKACTRYISVGKPWELPAAAGTRKTAFSGKVGSKALKAGKYRLSITASDALANVAAPKTAKFTIVR